MKTLISSLFTGIILISFSSKILGQNKALRATENSNAYTANVSYQEPSFANYTSSKLANCQTKNSVCYERQEEKDSESVKIDKLNENDFFIWNNALEKNSNTYFVIEKSIDDEAYFAIGYLQTPGITSQHATTIGGMQATGPLNYYRIKRIDKAGIERYSKKTIIIEDDTTSKSRISVTQSKMTENVKANFFLSENSEYMISIIDETGSLVSTITGTGSMGENNVIIDTPKIKKGAYYMYISGANGLSHIAKFNKD